MTVYFNDLCIQQKNKKQKKRTQPDPRMIDVSCNPYTVLLSAFNGFFWVGGGLWGEGGGIIFSWLCFVARVLSPY